MSVAAPGTEQDLLVLADHVHTLAPGGPVRALLVRRGRIAAAGDPDRLRTEAAGAATLDLRGAVITPGLTDAHAHLTEWAFARRTVDLSEAPSPDAAAAEVGRFARNGSGWVRGRGWNPHRWRGAEPHRRLLDHAVPGRPVALQSHDMHALWVNTAALSAAGIDADTPDPEGGTIVRDGDGQPTGLLLEWAGPLVTSAIAPPTLDDAVAAALDAQAELHSLGFTGIHSFPGLHIVEPDALSVVRAMRERGALRLRVLQHVPVERLDEVIAAGLRSGDGDELVRIGAVKMFLDGALGSRTAWMREPYEDGSGCGMRTMEPTVFRAHVHRAAQAGIATTVHAIGDAAVCLALDVLCSAPQVERLPHRIEHVQCLPAERAADLARADIVASMQPSHLITDWRIADRHWGERRARTTFALRTLLAHGTVFACGSDVPVEPVDPRRAFHAGVNRQDLSGEPDGGWQPAERIAALDVLRGFTTGAAHAAGLPRGAGSLGPGQPADFAAWDRDPGDDSTAFMDMQCIATAFGGAIVHRL